jgi:hypothetical protein
MNPLTLVPAHGVLGFRLSNLRDSLRELLNEFARSVWPVSRDCDAPEPRVHNPQSALVAPGVPPAPPAAGFACGRPVVPPGRPHPIRRDWSGPRSGGGKLLE